MEENTIPPPDKGGATLTANEPPGSTTNEIADNKVNAEETMDVVNILPDEVVTQAEPAPDNKPDADAKPEKDAESEKSEQTEKKDEYNCIVTVEVDDNGKADEENLTVNDLVDVEKVSDTKSDSELGPESSEKEPNKSLSRELKSLMKSAKESKIISECTQVKTKMRKSRTQDGTEANSIQERRSSVNSQKSNSSERSDKTSQKRSMRSSNPDFVNKHKRFLHSLTVKGQKENLDSSHSPHSDSDLDSGDESKMNSTQNESIENLPKCQLTVEKQLPETSMRLRTDSYCWRCHWPIANGAQEKAAVQPPARCTVCPRSLHYKCLTANERTKYTTDKNWVCPECLTILNAESSNTRSPAMRKISLPTLCELLRYALKRMMDLNGVEPFVNPVDRDVFPDYDKYVVHPMDLSHMSENITAGLYGSTEAFTADALWILHNSIIFNTVQSKLTAAARSLVRSCRTEMAEIETCPECYAAAHARRPTWFTDVCSSPHVLLWAKLKGFPYWPAKGMSVNATGMVDVRFFGAHDRAWVPARDCYLYCEKDPNNFRTKRQDIIDSMQEAEQHIRTISRKFGSFVHAAFKTLFEPSKINEQLKMMIPGFQGEVTTAVKFVKEKNTSVTSSPLAKGNRQRSNSKSSKDSFLDGYVSEDDEASKTSSLHRKMADGAEIAREEDENKDNNKTQPVEKGVVMLQSASSTSRKRRRSALEEAILTILEGTGEKRKRPDSAKPEDTQKPDDKEENKDTTKNLSTCSIEPMSVDKKANDSESKKDNVEVPQESAKTHEKPKDAVEKVTPKIYNLSTKTTKSVEVVVPEAEKDKDTKVVKSATDETEKRAVARSRSSVSKDKSATEHSRRSRTPRDDKATAKPKSQSRTQRPRKSSTKPDKNAKSEPTVETTPNSQPDKSIVSISLVDIPDKPEKVQMRTSTPKNQSPTKSVKDCIIFDDDTTLADLARSGKPNVIVSVPGLPTISSIRSLSRGSNSVEIQPTPTQVTPESSVFTPTKVTTTKPQQQKKDDKPLGRVGVRAFARMTSQEANVATSTSTDQLRVEIKTEPVEEEERQTEKIDLLNTIKLRPVGQVNTTNLREIRINKTTQSKIAPRPTMVRPMAKKTFPQPKKPDDGRSELNNKNSMVYIPIQQTSSQAPTRVTASRPQCRANGTSSSIAGKSTSTMVTANAMLPGNMVNTLTTPLMQVACVQPVSMAQAVGAGAVVATPSAGHTIGQVPTNVHTVPLVTSVNGQWTFSLQPFMSVGSNERCMTILDQRNDVNTQSPSNEPPPLVNGVAERPGGSAPAPATAQAARDATAQCNAEGGSQGDVITLPRLQQRPLLNPLDTSTPIGDVPTPSSAGGVTAKLNQSAVKLADFFRNLLEDSLEKLNEPEAQLTIAKLQLEQERWKHQQEMAEHKHNYDLTLAEMRAAMEKEKSRAISETRRVCQAELEAAVSHTKSRQWCANCRQEAQFYCCWNTSYCDYPCQRAHWTQHFASCSQQRPQSSSAAAAPTLTVGGKVVQPRVYSATPNPGKQSIFVSMIDDGSGNQTVKCLGTYKTNATPQNNPVLINKQIMNSEDSTKKVVTPGYIIVSGAGPNPSILLN